MENFVHVGTGWVGAKSANVFKTTTATASGDTAVWTPASGKKFRLLGFQIDVTGQSTLAGAATLNIILREGTTAIGLGVSVYVPAAAVNTMNGFSSGFIPVGNGYLAAADAVLNVNLSAALTAGVVRVMAIGTEE